MATLECIYGRNGQCTAEMCDLLLSAPRGHISSRGEGRDGGAAKRAVGPDT